MNSIFNEENLTTFIAVVKSGNFSQAARELDLTTSAVSYTIKRIELYLGTTLFIRSTRSVELTDSGYYFYRKAEELLDAMNSIKRGVHTIEKGIESKLKICINQLLFLPEQTARLLQVLKRQFPSCQITVITEVYNGVWDAIINNKADIAIGAPGILWDGGGIDYQEIGAIHWEFAISKHHPLALMPEPIKESILRSYPNIMVQDTATTINQKIGWLLYGQEIIQVPDFFTKCQCQILGEGIGFIPDYMAKEPIENGLLVSKKIENPRQKSNMLLATKHTQNGIVTKWIQRQFQPDGILTEIYRELLHPE